MKRASLLLVSLLAIATLVLTACQPQTVTVVQTVPVKETVPVVITPTPAPSPVVYPRNETSLYQREAVGAHPPRGTRSSGGHHTPWG